MYNRQAQVGYRLRMYITDFRGYAPDLSYEIGNADNDDRQINR